jgi:4-alpha-glucanotransferase
MPSPVVTNAASNTLPPFPSDYRASGVLLHVISLPTAYGIGDIGPAAVAWIDRLAESGQSWWQALPLGPTGYGNSPYQPLSSFAGNALIISPDWLIQDELLHTSDCQPTSFAPGAIDYDAVISFKYRLLENAWANFNAGVRSDLRAAYEQFRHDQAHWLDDYALFRALKIKFDNVHYLQWPEDLVQRKPTAMDRARHNLKDSIERVYFGQFLLFRQGERLKTHARARGVRLMGDLPFFVSPDSTEVWANPQFFLLDSQRHPRFVAGVPPDYFSTEGQLWGNPVYDWDNLRRTGYRWCMDRFRSLLCHVDAIRLDHFRGFAAAWHVPAGSPAALSGEWVSGPGADFLSSAQRELGALPFIAEDLGLITADVHALRDQFHLAGTRVLQFAFDGDAANPHLPHNYNTNTVVYTGTHDNPPTRAWFEDLPDEQRRNFRTYCKQSGAQGVDAALEMLALAWSSPAVLAMAPLQDLLNLGSEARMNMPGRADGNWRWRATDDMLSNRAFEWLREVTKASNRSGEQRRHNESNTITARPGSEHLAGQHHT